jgi:hypothetical protein
MGPEAKIEEAVTRYAKRRGCRVYKFTSPSRRSVPDRLFITPNGVTGYLELKAKGKKPTKAQAHQMRLIEEKNAPVDYADSKEKAFLWVDWLLTLPGPFPEL